MRMLKLMVFAAAILASGCGVDLKGLASQVKSRVQGATKDAAKPAEAPTGRLVMFIGVDISGSFMNGRYFNDSIDFLAHYIHAHLNGLGGMEVPNALFVGSIGGVKRDEVKTLYPIETFEHRSIEQIAVELHQIFPAGRVNTYTDFNAFFTQVGDMIDQKKLLLKPVSIVLMTDGDPDLGPGDAGNVAAKYRRLSLSPLEGLSRNITVRVLYTSAVVARNWRDEVPRKRVKVWTQDAVVMADWKDPKIMLPDTPFEKQTRFFSWLNDNVDFTPRLKRVD